MGACLDCGRRECICSHDRKLRELRSQIGGRRPLVAQTAHDAGRTRHELERELACAYGETELLREQLDVREQQAQLARDRQGDQIARLDSELAGLRVLTGVLCDWCEQGPRSRNGTLRKQLELVRSVVFHSDHSKLQSTDQASGLRNKELRSQAPPRIERPEADGALSWIEQAILVLIAGAVVGAMCVAGARHLLPVVCPALPFFVHVP